MKKLLFGTILLLMAIASHADQPSPLWNLFGIPDAGGKTVGYIYEIYAIGTLYNIQPEKNLSAIRLICPSNGISPPVIALFWEGAKGLGNNQHLDIMIDRHIIQQEWYWTQEETLTYRPLLDSKELIDAMKLGHTISFNWFDNNAKRRRVIFSLISFNLYLNDFNAVCKL